MGEYLRRVARPVKAIRQASPFTAAGVARQEIRPVFRHCPRPPDWLRPLSFLPATPERRRLQSRRRPQSLSSELKHPDRPCPSLPLPRLHPQPYLLHPESPYHSPYSLNMNAHYSRSRISKDVAVRTFSGISHRRHFFLFQPRRRIRPFGVHDSEGHILR